MEQLTVLHVFAAMIGANVVTGMFLYGIRAVMKNEADFFAYLLILGACLPTIGAVLTVW